MKKLKLFAFTLITFLCLGVISVNAETETVENLDQYKAAIKNSNTTEIKIGGDETEFDIRRLSDSRNDDAIIVNKNIVLDLNGHTIITGDIPGNTSAIKVFYHGNYTLTIKDSLKTGKIHSYCDNIYSCSSAPIVLLNTNNCNPATTNCDSKLVLQDITISTSTQSFGYMINIGTPDNSSKYNVEISNVEFENNSLANQLFTHNFAYNPTSPILNLNIKSMNGTNINYINEDYEYKVKDILDSSNTELLVNETLIDPETFLSDCDVSDGFKIRQKSVIDVIFDEKQYGYSSISAKPITIKNNSLTSIQIKSVSVSDTNKFTVLGDVQPTITVNSTDNSSFTVKPVDGLGVGEHTAIITVTDMDDKTYTANVKFTVGKADITPSVSIAGWFFGDAVNAPSVTGNLGNGVVTYEYKVQGSSDTTYSAVVPTSSGKYTIRALIGPSINYNGAVATANFSVEYKVIDGDGQKHTIGKNENAVFKINADKDLFFKVYLNDEELDSAFYTITEGSTIITLKQDFINNLLPNTYNLRVTFSDGGEATATFVIAQPAENNPQTGDFIMLPVILGSISLIGLLGVGLFLKKLYKVKLMKKLGN